MWTADKIINAIQAIGVILAAYWAYRAKVHSVENGVSIKDVHTQINGRMDQMVATAFKEGGVQEKIEPTGSGPVALQMTGEPK